MGKEKKKKVIGGARKGAGRKPVADKKVAVTLYIQESIIQSFGGIDNFRDHCYAILIENKINK